MTIYIIILHYKHIEDTKACLESVRRLQKDSFMIKTILINNNPVEDIRTLSADIHIQNKENIGFAKAVNTGISKAMEDEDMQHVMLLNNDTLVPVHLLIKTLAFDGDIVGPVIKFKSIEGDWIYDYGGRINWTTGRTTHIEKDHLHDTTVRFGAIDYISGCCMIISRRVIEDIGLLDERFFFYFEDVDYCVRAKKKKYSIMVCPDIAIEHKLSGSIGRWSTRAILYNLRSNALFITKHLGYMIPVGYMYLILLTFKIGINKVFFHR